MAPAVEFTCLLNEKKRNLSINPNPCVRQAQNEKLCTTVNVRQPQFARGVKEDVLYCWVNCPPGGFLTQGSLFSGPLLLTDELN